MSEADAASDTNSVDLNQEANDVSTPAHSSSFVCCCCNKSKRKNGKRCAGTPAGTCTFGSRSLPATVCPGCIKKCAGVQMQDSDEFICHRCLGGGSFDRPECKQKKTDTPSGAKITMADIVAAFHAHSGPSNTEDAKTKMNMAGVFAAVASASFAAAAALGDA
jgi:hypothetical protein